jgi:hypothetical protein
LCQAVARECPDENGSRDRADSQSFEKVFARHGVGFAVYGMSLFWNKINKNSENVHQACFVKLFVLNLGIVPANFSREKIKQ